MPFKYTVIELSHWDEVEAEINRQAEHGWEPFNIFKKNTYKPLTSGKVEVPILVLRKVFRRPRKKKNENIHKTE